MLVREKPHQGLPVLSVGARVIPKKVSAKAAWAIIVPILPRLQIHFKFNIVAHSTRVDMWLIPFTLINKCNMCFMKSLSTAFA